MTAMTRHSAQALTDGWISFLKLHASRTGINVVVGENVSAETDGNTVYFPSLPVNLTEKDLILFKSDGFHEFGHIRHSDVPFFMAFAKQHGEFAGFLLNALDDVYMERKQSVVTREAEGYFRQSAEIMFERKQFRDGSASPAEAVGCYALCYLFARAWSEYDAALKMVKENFDRHFGEHAENVRANLEAILYHEFPSVQSTQHGGDLTLRIIAMLKALSNEEQKKPEESKKPGQQPGKKEGEKSPEGNSGDGQGGGKSPEEKKSEQSGGDSKGGESETGSQANQQGNAQPQGDEKPSEEGKAGNGKGQSADNGNGASQGAGASGPTLKEIVDGIINAKGLGDREVCDVAATIKGISESVAANKNPDYKNQTLVPKFVIDGKVTGPAGKSKCVGGGAGIREVVDGIDVCPQDHDEARTMEGKLGRKVQVLATRLQALLMQQEEAEAYSTHRGDLGQMHLYRFGMGDTRIFTQQEEMERPTAAVSVVLDLSSSTMDEDDKKFATGKNPQFVGAKPPSIARSIAQTALIFEKVLDQIGTPREILGFAPKDGKLMTMVRSFGDSHMAAVKRIGGLRRIVGGNHTPIGEAVFHAGRRLIGHDAQKKVMFVLTDGSPSSVEKAVEMTHFCESSGIRVVYLVIGEKVRTDWLTEAKIPFACANTADEVGPVLIEEAKKLLL